MSLLRNSLPVVAPVEEIATQVAKGTSFDWSAFFSAYKAKKNSTVLFYQVAPSSELFRQSIEQTTVRGFKPCFIYNANNFVDFSQDLLALLADGHSLALLITEELPPVLLDSLERLSRYKEQLSLVVLGRRDWNFMQTLRTIPYFLRDRLYLDFPMSYFQEDAFYAPEDLISLAEYVDRSVLGDTLPSFCPHLASYVECSAPQGLEAPIRFDAKTFPFIPVVTVICRDEESLQQLLASSQFWQNQEQIEVIGLFSTQEQLLRFSNQFQGGSLFFQPPKGGEAGALLNQMSDEAQGSYLFFADQCSTEVIDLALSDFFDESHAASDIAINHRIPFINSEKFTFIGGFNPIFKSSDAARLDILLRLSLSRPLEERISWCQSLVFDASIPNHETRAMAQSHFRDLPVTSVFRPRLEKKFDAVETEPVTGLNYRWRKLKDIYSQLLKFNASVILEGHLAFLGIIFGVLWRPFQRLTPWILWAVSFLDVRRYRIYWSIRHLFRANLWRLRSRQLRWVLYSISKPGRWVLRELYHASRKYLWWLAPRQVGWFIYRLLAPFRMLGVFYRKYLRVTWYRILSFVRYRVLGIFDVKRYTLYWSLRHLLKTNLWRLSPKRVFRFIRIFNIQRYSFYWSLRHLLKTNLWRLSPKRPFAFLNSRLVIPFYHWARVFFSYKLPFYVNPKSYSVFWRLRHQVLCNVWRLHPRQLGWFLFKISFPLRKIYYFCRFQYEKRILRLHRKRPT